MTERPAHIHLEKVTFLRPARIKIVHSYQIHGDRGCGETSAVNIRLQLAVHCYGILAYQCMHLCGSLVNIYLWKCHVLSSYSKLVMKCQYLSVDFK